MSTEKKIRFSKEWKIGLVSAAVIAMFVWVCFFLAGRNIFSSENTYYAVFENSGGINVSSPVVVNGKKVGRVSSIEFVSETDHNIKIALGIKKKYPIPQGTVASLESLGLMSGSGIVLHLGNSAEMMKTGQTLQGRQVPDLMAQLAPMESTISSILGSLDSILGKMNSVLDTKKVGDLGESLDALHASLTNVEGITSQANALLAENRPRLNRMIANIENLSEMLKDKKGDLANAISNFSAISDTLAKAELGEAVRSLKESLSQAEALLAGVNTGKGSVGQLLTNDTLYENLEKSSKQLSLLLQDLRINPERYVHISVFGRKEKKKDKPTE
ncbi:MAG: MlaD family protein [Bacteroides sp.]|nr:MlaD family protein [Ruminococcus flavefaciens]MCM1554061.1 MlaD family protein [Bacteroides sp.]